jgi:hypothetical protein
MPSKTNIPHHDFLEKRKYPRIPVKIKFVCKKNSAISGVQDGLLEIYSKDLSSSGVLLEQCPGFSEGYLLEMEFTLPSSTELMKVKGLIIRKDQYGSGVRFLTLNMTDFETIDSFISKNLSMPE